MSIKSKMHDGFPKSLIEILLPRKYNEFLKSLSYIPVSKVAHQQIYGTCYAHAIATAIRATQSRIISRKVDTHSKIVNELVKKYGKNGADTYEVLKEQCKKRKLRCETINKKNCQEALKNGRIVVASFYLDRRQWEYFSSFFLKQPDGILTKINIPFQIYQKEGHSVVIVSQKKNYWIMKNSWGQQFGQYGYFRIAKNALEFEFIDVYYLDSDLSQQEKWMHQGYQKLILM